MNTKQFSKWFMNNFFKYSINVSIFHFTKSVNHLRFGKDNQGGHGTGKTGNLIFTFSRQGKHREFGSDTGKNLLAQGKYLDCDY